MSSQQPDMMTRRRSMFALALLGCLLLMAVAPTPGSARALQKGFWGPTAVDGVSQFPLYKKLGVSVYQDGALVERCRADAARESPRSSGPGLPPGFYAFIRGGLTAAQRARER